MSSVELEINTSISHKELCTITVFNQDGNEVEFDFYAMAHGEDFLGFEFIYGLLPHRSLYYSFMYSNIIRVKSKSGTPFTGSPMPLMVSNDFKIIRSYKELVEITNH